MSMRFLLCGCVPVAVMLAAGCSSLPYSPRTLDPDASAAEYAQRSAGADGLRRFAAANGYDKAWPPAEWGLRELTLTALYFHPDMRTARARAEVARAELASAAQPQALAARVKPEHHSNTSAETDSPWSLGLELEIPLVAQGKREARIERSAFFADAADLDIASASWSVRSRVRDRMLELQAAREALALIEAQLAARREMLGLVSRRVDAGMLSARDLGAERVAIAQLELARDQESARRQGALGELAAALGLPLEVVSGMKLDFASVEAAGIATDAGNLHRLALRNRLDVHRKLVEFGAADADVKFAVASQNPDFVIGPGYMWDQGDNVWSLALGFTVPPAARVRAAIREAEARRELAAQQFAAVQSEAIAQTEQAAAQFRSARERLAGARNQQQLQREQQARVDRQFDAGAVDRLQRAAVRIETLAAESVLLSARVQSRQALARLEDAVQRPLSGDLNVLPDSRVPFPAEDSRQ